MLKNIPTLQTQRLQLRRFGLADAPALFAYASDPLVTRFITWRTQIAVEEATDFVQGILDWYRSGEVAYWAIIRRDNGQLIGSCGLFDWQPNPARAELAFVLARPYWGQGFISEAVRELMRYGFEELGLIRLEARCVVQNTASARVMERAGMTYEGTLRHYIYIKGQLYDLKVYSLLREEWQTQKGL